MDANALVNAQDTEGVTPLYIAARKNYASLVRLFLTLPQQSQPPPPAQDPLAGFGGSAGLSGDWGGALFTGDSSTSTSHHAQQQQRRRVDVNVTTKEGDTPLFIASFYGFVEVVQLLLDHGADVNIKFNGVTPLSMAKKNNHREVVNLLERNSWRKANSRHPVPLSPTRPSLQQQRPPPFPTPSQFTSDSTNPNATDDEYY